MRSLGGLSHQGDGGSGARPVCPADAGAVRRGLSAAGAPGPPGTPRPTQPRPRDSAAGLETHTSHKTSTAATHGVSRGS